MNSFRDQLGGDFDAFVDGDAFGGADPIDHGAHGQFSAGEAAGEADEVFDFGRAAGNKNPLAFRICRAALRRISCARNVTVTGVIPVIIGGAF
jgi:hypothetical protein